MYIELLGPFTIAAGETKRFETEGRYLEIIDSAAAVNITFGDPASGGQAGRAIGALSGFYVEAAYKGFEIWSAVSQSVTMLVTDGSGGSRRQPGNVRIIDNAADKTKAGNQYIGNISSAVNAGLVSAVGINPKAATLAVKRLTLSSATAGPISLYRGTGIGSANPDYPNPIQNKLVGGATSTSRVSTGNTGAALPTAGEMPGAVFWMSQYVPANTPIEVPLSTPLVLSGANVLLVSGVTINRDVLAVFDFEEA